MESAVDGIDQFAMETPQAATGSIDQMITVGDRQLRVQITVTDATVTPVPVPIPVPIPVPTPAPTPTPQPSATVTLSVMGIQPQSITVKPGDTVTWRNAEPAQPHELRADDRSFGSGTLPAGAQWMHTFATPGTYRYFDAYFGAPGQAGPWNGVVVVQGAPTPVPTPVPTPTPTPSGKLNVRDYGAKGDGQTDDTPAIQRAIAAAAPGKELYFPAGDYLLGSGLSVQTNGLGFSGDGDASRLRHGLSAGVHVGGAGLNVQDFAVHSLCFVGAPGKFNGDGNNAAHTILCDGSKNVVVQDVLFIGPAHAVYEVNGHVGMTIERCRVQGWGRVAFGVGDNATIRDCVLTQNYPDPAAKGIDYGVYLHNSCKQVLVERNIVQGSGGYAVHYWAQSQVGGGGPVTIRDNRFIDNSIGMIIASNPGTVGRLAGITVQRNTWKGFVRGTCVVFRMGDGIVFEGNTIDSGKAAVDTINSMALAVGLWSPNDEAGSLTNAVFRNNTIKGWDFGLYAAATNGGKFQGVTVGPNMFADCRRSLIADPSTPGLTVVA